MSRILFWWTIWAFSAFALTIDVEYSDGVTIHLKGWWPK